MWTCSFRYDPEWGVIRMTFDPMVTQRKRLRRIGRQDGALAAVRRVIDRLAQRALAVEVSRLLWLDVERLVPPPPADPEITFRFLGADAACRLLADPRNRTDLATAGPVLSEGDLCFAALAGDRLAAYGWYALGPVDPRHCGGVALSLPGDVAYFYNGFTQPEFRGKGLYGQLMGLGSRALVARGIRGVLASVAWTNSAALKSSFRLGYVDLGCFVGVGRGRWKLLFPPRSAKRLGIGFRNPT
jgi:hypothetical protein